MGQIIAREISLDEETAEALLAILKQMGFPDWGQEHFLPTGSVKMEGSHRRSCITGNHGPSWRGTAAWSVRPGDQIRKWMCDECGAILTQFLTQGETTQ